jgi:anti-sigma factor RsiW
VIERAISETIDREPELVRAAAARTPKAWGALAAQGVLAFRELSGRPPTEAERRAIWSGLWRAAEETAARG